MKTLNRIINGLAFAGLAFASQAMAATDGTVGLTSTGTSVVSLTVNDRVQISSVADIALGAYAGSGNMSGQSTYCVHRNGGDNYRLTLTTNEGAFQVSSATTSDIIPFTVNVDDDTDASVGGEAMSYNTASAVAMVGHVSAACGGADNAALEVTFAEANLQAVSSASDYNATMTILVEPI
jgi:spore coat protein U-like protein